MGRRNAPPQYLGISRTKHALYIVFAHFPLQNYIQQNPTMAPYSTQSRPMRDKSGIKALLRKLGNGDTTAPLYREFQDFMKTFVSSQGLRGTEIVYKRDRKHIDGAFEMVTSFLQQPKEGYASLGHYYWPEATAGIRSGLLQFPKNRKKCVARYKHHCPGFDSY